MNGITNISRNENPDFLVPGIPGGIESGDQNSRIAATKKLETILKEGKVEPAVADAIRKQLVALQTIAIENGETPVVPADLGKQSAITTKASQSDKNLSGEYLTRALSGEIDLIKASETGAGFEPMQRLIEEAKRKAAEQGKS